MTSSVRIVLLAGILGLMPTGHGVLGLASCGLANRPRAHADQVDPGDAGAGAQVPDVGAPASAEAAIPRATTLGTGDVFEVRVFEEAGLSGVFRVDADGSIDYPLCGSVKVAGLDASGAAAAITKCLRAGYLKSPQVSVFIKEYNSKKIFVFGEVQKPGTFTYEDGMSIVEAITRAGGFTKTASKNAVIISRVIDGREQRLKVPVEDIGVGRASNFVLKPGDIVFVPESFF